MSSALSAIKYPKLKKSNMHMTMHRPNFSAKAVLTAVILNCHHPKVRVKLSPPKRSHHATNII